MHAYYHSVETFGTVDGRGIRYVLFLAGCTLGCAFCHNPDTWSRGDKTITVAEVLTDFAKYRPFYEASGGGITVSGGEPLLQAEFVAELFKACREQGIHTTLDTSGYASRQSLALVAPYTDEALFCVKAIDPLKHKELTAADNTLILDNLSYLAQVVPLTLRYVIIPGVNNSEADILALADLVKTLPQAVAVELLAYHTLGREKWAKLGLAYRFDGIPDATEDDIAGAKRQLESQGIAVLYHG